MKRTTHVFTIALLTCGVSSVVAVGLLAWSESSPPSSAARTEGVHLISVTVAWILGLPTTAILSGMLGVLEPFLAYWKLSSFELILLGFICNWTILGSLIAYFFDRYKQRSAIE